MLKIKRQTVVTGMEEPMFKVTGSDAEGYPVETLGAAYLNLFYDAVNAVNNPKEVQDFCVTFVKRTKTPQGRLLTLMLKKKAALYHQRPSQMILHPYQITLYPLLAMAIDGVVFAIGYEQELEEKLMDRQFQAFLHDKDLKIKSCHH